MHVIYCFLQRTCRFREMRTSLAPSLDRGFMPITCPPLNCSVPLCVCVFFSHCTNSFSQSHGLSTSGWSFAFTANTAD